MDLTVIFKYALFAALHIFEFKIAAVNITAWVFSPLLLRACYLQN